MRIVPRRKAFVTSLCASAGGGLYGSSRRPGCYHFDRECLCPSPEWHRAQFEREERTGGRGH